MNIYLVCHSEYQSVVECNSHEEITVKYPNTVTAIIKLSDSVIEDIKNGEYLHQGDNA